MNSGGVSGRLPAARRAGLEVVKKLLTSKDLAKCASGRRLAERRWRPVGTKRAPPEAAVTVGPAQDLSIHHQLHPGRVAEYQLQAAPRCPAPPLTWCADPIKGQPAIHPALGPDPGLITQRHRDRGRQLRRHPPYRRRRRRDRPSAINSGLPQRHGGPGATEQHHHGGCGFDGAGSTAQRVWLPHILSLVGRQPPGRLRWPVGEDRPGRGCVCGRLGSGPELAG